MRPESLNGLFRQVSQINGVGPKTSKLIESLCGPYIVDVVFSLPSGVNYRPLYKNEFEIRLGQLGTIPFLVEKPLLYICSVSIGYFSIKWESKDFTSVAVLFK